MNALRPLCLLPIANRCHSRRAGKGRKPSSLATSGAEARSFYIGNIPCSAEFPHVILTPYEADDLHEVDGSADPSWRSEGGRMTAIRAIAEPIWRHRLAGKAEALDRAAGVCSELLRATRSAIASF